MESADFKPVKRYITSLKPHLLKGLLFAGGFLVCGLLLLRESPLPGLAAATTLLAVILLGSWLSALKRYRQSVAELHAHSSEAAAAADFAAAQEVPGMGRVGREFYFGYGVGVLVRLPDVDRVELVVHKYTDDGHTHRQWYLEFVMMDGSRRWLCSLHSRRQHERAHAVRQLLSEQAGITDQPRRP